MIPGYIYMKFSQNSTTKILNKKRYQIYLTVYQAWLYLFINKRMYRYLSIRFIKIISFYKRLTRIPNQSLDWFKEGTVLNIY